MKKPTHVVFDRNTCRLGEGSLAHCKKLAATATPAQQPVQLFKLAK